MSCAIARIAAVKLLASPYMPDLFQSSARVISMSACPAAPIVPRKSVETSAMISPPDWTTRRPASVTVATLRQPIPSSDARSENIFSPAGETTQSMPPSLSSSGSISISRPPASPNNAAQTPSSPITAQRFIMRLTMALLRKLCILNSSAAFPAALPSPRPPSSSTASPASGSSSLKLTSGAAANERSAMTCPPLYPG